MSEQFDFSKTSAAQQQVRATALSLQAVLVYAQPAYEKISYDLIDLKLAATLPVVDRKKRARIGKMNVKLKELLRLCTEATLQLTSYKVIKLDEAEARKISARQLDAREDIRDKAIDVLYSAAALFPDNTGIQSLIRAWLKELGAPLSPVIKNPGAGARLIAARI